MENIYNVVDEYDVVRGDSDALGFREAASYWLGDEEWSRNLTEYSDYDWDEWGERIRRAGRWAETYSPDHDYTVVSPEDRGDATRVVAHILEDARRDRDSEELQNLVYEWADHFDRSVGDVFSELYQHLLGREDGPRAGRLLASIPAEEL